jgi:coatomer protein complex subunit alpha (xenin)
MTAKSHGLTEECESILEATGLTEDQISLPAIGEPLSTPRPIVSTFKANWPTKATSQSFFEKALLGQVEGLSLEDDPSSTTNGFGFDEAGDEDGAVKKSGVLIDDDDDEDAAGWDMGDDIVPEVESEFVNVESSEAGVGSSEAELWARNSPLAADHVAGGSFETAMQLLNRQVGAVNFAPLKPRFMSVYEVSRTYLPATIGLPPIINYVRRNTEESDIQKVLPAIPNDIESIATNDLQRGYDSVRGNKLDDGAVIFKKMLHSLLVNAVQDASEVSEAKKLIAAASEYSVAIAIELSRRKLGTNEEVAKSPEKLKRSLELSAYFTIPKLEVVHRQLALMSAMKLAYTNKNLSSALSFANRILANGGGAKALEQVSNFSPISIILSNNRVLQAKKIKAQCERNPNDANEIEYDQFAEFDICAASHTPIYGGSSFETCAFDGSKYQSKYKGTVCTVCEVCEVGKNGSGLKLIA